MISDFDVHITMMNLFFQSEKTEGGRHITKTMPHPYCGPTRNKFSVTRGRCRSKDCMKGRQDSFKCQASNFIYNLIRNLESQGFKQANDIQIQYRKMNVAVV
jgi:hypothetical protein